MKNAIIGSNGFIGGALKRYADTHHKGEWVGITRQNYRDYINKKFDHLIWCAGTSSKRAPKEDLYREHVLGVALALSDFRFRSFVYLSSQSVYNDTGKIASEKDPIRINNLTDYGRYKLLGEKLVKYSSPRWLCIRANGFVGPSLSKNVVYDLTQENPKLFVAWDSKIQYMHVDTFSEILFGLIYRWGSWNQVINVTSTDPISPADIAHMLHLDIKKVKVPTNKVVPRLYAVLNTTKLQKILRYYNVHLPSSRDEVLLSIKEKY